MGVGETVRKTTFGRKQLGGGNEQSLVLLRVDMGGSWQCECRVKRRVTTSGGR